LIQTASRLFSCLTILLALLVTAAPALADPVEPEKAFPMSVRALNADTVEVRFDIRRNYYLYDERFGFASRSDGVALGAAEIPPGETYRDEFFGDTVIHRGRLAILLPVSTPDGAGAFELEVKSQGCWDGGICYPPETRVVTVSLDAGSGGGGGLLDRALSTPPAAAGGDTTTPPRAASGAVSGDESGRIAGLLGDANLALVLASFFGFGLLLAFTPCTFPMIPILSGIIVGQGHHVSHTRAGVLSVAYVLGMAVTYAAAGVAAGLSGTLLATALQNVWVLGGFAVVFVLLALSMFGFYELQMPSALQSRISETASHRKGGHLGGVAAMGALSALIVGPCVAAPLAGALLYIAQTGDAVLGGAALFVMALGMGAPLIAVGVGTRSLLPKIGPWMEGVKKAFGVMLLAVALWLVSPVIPAAATMLGWALLLGFSGIFLHALDPLPTHAGGWRRFWKGFGVMLLIAGAAMLIGLLAGSRDPLQPLSVLRAGGATQVEQPRFERVASVTELDARLATADRPVMLDFYADWCVSCKEMERFTFADAAVAARMRNMLLLKADVTTNNADDKALLARFGLFGPPGIIFFDPAGQEIDGLRVVGFMRAGPFGEILDRALN
jgi:thiol:disulfide interchange protein DsbD